MIIYNSYISSNFNYCPIVWMFTGKLNFDKLEKSNKRAIRFISNDAESSYEQLCTEEKLLNIHKRCIKSVAIQMFKIKNQTAPDYLAEMFNVRETHYDIRNNNQFTLPSFNTITYGKKSFTYYGAKLWNNLPNEIKESSSLGILKKALTSWLENIESVSPIDFL